MSTATPPLAEPPPQPWVNPYPYGWREIPRRQADGSVEYERVPLTIEDALHPQLGDVTPQSEVHEDDRIYLRGVCEWVTRDTSGALVLFDMLVVWDHPELRPHSPDIAVCFGVKEPDKRDRTSFDVKTEGVRPRVIWEVVSPAYRVNDVDKKVDHYHRVRVPYYIIVDRKRVEGPVELIGYQYAPDGYVRMAADASGRLWVEPLGIWAGTRGNRLVCYDGKTGEELGDYVAMGLAAEAEKSRAETERQRAETERQRADAERQRADAERQRAEQEKARADAAAARIRELEEALRRRNGDSPPAAS